MKNLWIFILLISSTITNAQVIFEKSLSQAFAKAKQQNKAVFIEYYNSDCSVCKRLGKLLREDKAVIEYYNNNFINYALNTYNDLTAEEQSLMTSSNLNFNSVPVLLYFDKNKNFLHYSSGDISSETVIAEGQKAPLADYNASGLKAKYASGDRTIRTLYAYSNLLLITKDEQLLKKVTQSLYEAFPKSDLSSKKSYLILKRVVNSTENGFFQHWINNLESLKGFESAMALGTEKSQLSRIVLVELTDPNIKKWSDAKKDKFRNYIRKLQIVDDPEVFF